jgi:hypothetical protein
MKRWEIIGADCRTGATRRTGVYASDEAAAVNLANAQGILVESAAVTSFTLRPPSRLERVWMALSARFSRVQLSVIGLGCFALLVLCVGELANYLGERSITPQHAATSDVVPQSKGSGWTAAAWERDQHPYARPPQPPRTDLTVNDPGFWSQASSIQHDEALVGVRDRFRAGIAATVAAYVTKYGVGYNVDERIITVDSYVWVAMTLDEKKLMVQIFGSFFEDRGSKGVVIARSASTGNTLAVWPEHVSDPTIY